MARMAPLLSLPQVSKYLGLVSLNRCHSLHRLQVSCLLCNPSYMLKRSHSFPVCHTSLPIRVRATLVPTLYIFKWKLGAPQHIYLELF